MFFPILKYFLFFIRSQTSVKLNKIPMRIVSLIALFMLVFFGATAQTPENINFLNEGDKIPVFTIGTTDGDTISTIDLKGQTVVMVFFATWCPPCLKELPHVESEIWKKYKNNPKFKLYVIGREHTKEEVVEFASQRNFTFPLVADTDRSIFQVFAKQNIPRMYLINSESKIEMMTSGFNQTSFDELLEKLKEELKK